MEGGGFSEVVAEEGSWEAGAIEEQVKLWLICHPVLFYAVLSKGGGVSIWLYEAIESSKLIYFCNPVT